MDKKLNTDEGAWFGDLGKRTRRFWALKLHGSIAIIAAFFYCYFWVLHHPEFAVAFVPLTPVDRLVPFLPATVWIYFSLWPYVVLLPSLYDHRQPILRYLGGVGLLSGVGMAVFYFFPTAVPPGNQMHRAEHFGFGFLEGVDAAGNACPSLHVAFAVYTAAGLNSVLKDVRAPFVVRQANFAWSVAICFSTLTTGQHVFIDVMAGFALGLLCAKFVTTSQNQSASAGA
jgi:membrane-associated phospholipid phosphatase